MPQGVRIKGDHGFIQVGDQAPLFVLRSRGSVASVSGSGLQFMNSTAQVPRPSSSCLLAIRPADSMEVWGITADGLNFVLYGMAPVGTNIDYWTFDKASAVPDPGGFVGFRTRNAAGELIFAANMKPVRVVDVFNLNITPDYFEDRLYSAGRTYAVAQARMANTLKYRDGAVNPNTGAPEIGWFALNGYAGSFKGILNGINIVDHRHSEDSESTQTPDLTREKTITGSMMIVDVTHY